MTHSGPIEILLVEDNPDDAELTQRALRKSGVANEIEWLTDGAQALEFLFCEGAFADRVPVAPKLVLLDLKLPLVSGLEVLQRVKTDPRTKTIPIVMLTSSKQESDRVQSYGLGTNAFVVKPLHFDEFSEAVRALGLFWLVVNQPPPTADIEAL